MFKSCCKLNVLGYSKRISNLSEDACVICRKIIPKAADRKFWSMVTDAGLQSLMEFSVLRKDYTLNEYLLIKSKLI
jgi:hypothetical protein